MIQRRTRVFLWAATVVAAALMAYGWIRLSAPPDSHAHLQSLREQLALLCATADSCRDAVAAEENGLRAQRQSLDTLRERVRAYESLDPRGVPARHYDAYLESFERYNREAGDWPAASETLQAHWRACRGIAETHNAVTDSARALAHELGLWVDSVPSPGGG